MVCGQPLRCIHFPTPGCAGCEMASLSRWNGRGAEDDMQDIRLRTQVNSDHVLMKLSIVLSILDRHTQTGPRNFVTL
jgi:hypothetical protein